ncbi:DUF389 domain-containing protein [Natrononativus amylolyticus]|uniref:DUF389 domain-containing protein n=1 Tax=Natrononativus amylolyticus TaxID=2963434 RepID=UPI0020CE7421|nr:DUF389 domain-containing protein [Natrononativus amylolyticus]
MRVIQLRVTDDERPSVFDVLDDEGIDYVVTQETDDASLVQFPIPTQAVEHVFTRLREAGFDDQEYTVVMAAEAARTEHIDDLETRYVLGDEGGDNVAHEEIRSKALEMTPGNVTYYAMTLLSAFVATAGLLLDSPAIVVGSMVIAPQMSAALTGTVGTVLNDRKMIVNGVGSLVGGLVVAVLGSLAFAWFIRMTGFIPATVDISAIRQVEHRISPGLLAMLIGICAGAAGAFGLATALPVSLVGVMIAAALIPAAAAVGIGIAWGYPLVALGALVLLTVNTVAIVLSGLVVFWYLGYRPLDWVGGNLRSNVTRDRIGAIALAVLVLSAVMLGAGLVLGQHVAFESTASEETHAALSGDEYDDLELREIRADFYDHGLISDSYEVTIVIERPADEPYEEFPDEVAQRISDRTQQEVTVSVEFVEGGTSSGTVGSISPPGH